MENGGPRVGSPRPDRIGPAGVLAGAAVVTCLLVTVLVVTSSRLLLGVHDPGLHLVLDSVDACIALLVAYLLLGRFRRDRSARNLLLACGLVVLALANAAGTLLPSPALFTLDVWWPQALRVLGAGLIVAGALVVRPLSRRATVAVLAGVLGVVLVELVTLWLLRGALPVALTTTPASAESPTITGHPALIVAHLAGATCFLAAATVFTREARDRDDEMLRWFGPACILGAFSRVHYTLFPSIYSGWLYTGDLLRTGCYLLLLVGAAREISRYWSAQPRLAVAADRRRVARDLHDGVVQELGFIRAVAGGITEPDVRGRITGAADRGLDEARAALSILDTGVEPTLELQLRATARDLAERYDTRVAVDVGPSFEVSTDQARQLVRIAREAAGNAARHGGAGQITVALRRDPRGHVLVVQDDGRGFDPGVVRAGGYGLTSMRDRAAALAGRFEIRSEPGGGTEVTVTW